MIYKTSIIFFLLGLFSCNQNKIQTKESRMDLPEPDKEFRIDGEVKSNLSKISSEISISDSIVLCTSGQKLFHSGTNILPFLKDCFQDSTPTTVFSKCNNRTLKRGEIAILVANEISPIPIAQVVGIQQCTPPFRGVEYFLYRIEENPEMFISKYTDWITFKFKS
jgi:hypothetical protein